MITKQWRTDTVNTLIESINSGDHVYYAFISDHKDEGVTITPNDTTLETHVEVNRKIIAGQKIIQALPMIRKIDYVSNTVYNIYDDADPEIWDKNFYVCVDAGSKFHVYKCLNNAGNTASTVAPNIADVNLDDDFYQTSDGYVWKYMYTLPTAVWYNFYGSSPGYLPVVANTLVSNAATPGSLDSYIILNKGEGYRNHLSGSFSGDQIRVGGNTRIYAVGSNANQTLGLYTGCMIYLSTGTGAGQYKTITDYYSNGSGNYILIDTEFDVTPTSGSQWEITPRVEIVGDGFQTINAVARALINTVGNTVQDIQILNRGQGYTYASANIVANTVVGVTTPAQIKAVHAPPGGHGYDAASELGATAIGVSVRFSNTSTTIPITNYFTQIGIIRDPKFANVVVNVSNTTGVFSNGETINLISTIKLVSNATINVANLSILANTGFFDQQIRTGDWLYLESGDGLSHALRQVNSVTNATAITISSNVSWSCTASFVYKANIEGSMILNSIVDGNTINVSSLDKELNTDDLIVGVTSSAKGTVTSIERNGVTKDFSTFIGMHKFLGSVSGTFIPNETVYHGTSLANATSTAILHSIGVQGGSNTMFVTEQVGNFSDTTITGETSGATFTISERYTPEIVFGSGRVIYMGNIDPVLRANTQSEVLNLIVKF